MFKKKKKAEQEKNNQCFASNFHLHSSRNENSVEAKQNKISKNILCIYFNHIKLISGLSFVEGKFSKYQNKNLLLEFVLLIISSFVK